MQIVQIRPGDEAIIQQAARLLTDSFPLSDDWQTPEGALEEVHTVVEEGCAFAAMSGHLLLGWIGALYGYEYAWELHPLAVRADQQRKGVGRALVDTLENHARAKGILTMMLGTDDQDFQTTLSQVDDLYTDLAGHIATIRNLDESNPHPFGFYQKCGYQIVGLVPDANGARKPDIFMAKRLLP